MKDRQVFYNYITVYDDNVFTRKKGTEWGQQLVNAYEKVFHALNEQMDKSSPVTFHISLSLVEEVIVDAIIGMRKITDSTNNDVKTPNAFKIAAYLSYWWLRHKPAYLHYPSGYRLDDVNLSEKQIKTLSIQDQEHMSMVFRWKLKHVNELVAVQFVSTYIFNFDKTVCGCFQNRWVKLLEGERFPFDDFDDMRREIISKLTYYFSYRALAPKVIEHILEAYTFHPAWDLTGNLWSGDEADE